MKSAAVSLGGLALVAVAENCGEPLFFGKSISDTGIKEQANFDTLYSYKDKGGRQILGPFESRSSTIIKVTRTKGNGRISLKAQRGDDIDDINWNTPACKVNEDSYVQECFINNVDHGSNHEHAWVRTNVEKGTKYTVEVFTEGQKKIGAKSPNEVLVANKFHSRMDYANFKAEYYYDPNVADLDETFKSGESETELHYQMMTVKSETGTLITVRTKEGQPPVKLYAKRSDNDKNYFDDQGNVDEDLFTNGNFKYRCITKKWVDDSDDSCRIQQCYVQNFDDARNNEDVIVLIVTDEKDAYDLRVHFDGEENENRRVRQCESDSGRGGQKRAQQIDSAAATVGTATVGVTMAAMAAITSALPINW